MNRMLKCGIFALSLLIGSSAVADVYYTEVVKALDGASGADIAEAWEQHKNIWKKKGYDPDDTVLRLKTTGGNPLRTYYFHFRADDHAELGKILEHLLTDPEFQEMGERWDQIRVIESSDTFQSL